MSDTDTHVETALTLADLLAIYKDIAEAEDSWKARKVEVRAQIDKVLRAEYDANGTLPTHRMKGVGTAYLTGGESKATVSQPQAFAEWVAERMPEAVSFVATFPRKVVDSDQFQRAWSTVQMLASDTTSVVDPAALDTLASGGHLDAESGQLVTGNGEVVEGVRVVESSPYLVVKPVKASLTTRETSE